FLLLLGFLSLISAGEEPNVDRLMTFFEKNSRSFNRSELASIFVKESRRIGVKTQSHVDYCTEELEKFQLSATEKESLMELFNGPFERIVKNTSDTKQILEMVKSEDPRAYAVIDKIDAVLTKFIDQTSNDTQKFANYMVLIFEKVLISCQGDDPFHHKDFQKAYVIGAGFSYMNYEYGQLSNATLIELEQLLCARLFARILMLDEIGRDTVQLLHRYMGPAGFNVSYLRFED
ncbi:hypothetical protein PFISCL1PPCAC_18046, partial [Pristionchus fissidentatus]